MNDFSKIPPHIHRHSGAKQRFLVAALLCTTISASTALAQQVFNGNQETTGPFSQGNQLFYNRSVLNAVSGGAVSGGSQIFYDESKLNASSGWAISGGSTQTFRDSSTLNVSAVEAIAGGKQYFGQNSSLVVVKNHSIIGGEQSFYDSSILQLMTYSPVTGGTQNFYDESKLHIASGDCIAGGAQNFYDNSTLYPSYDSDLYGFGIMRGTQNFHDNSILNAWLSLTIGGGTQNFKDTSSLNASASGAIGYGVQNFYDNSTLNATGRGVVGQDSAQNFKDTSSLNASVTEAIRYGVQNFYDNSTLNASARSAIWGAVQSFSGNSTLNATAAGAVGGGIQNFYETSSLNASVAGAVGGGTQNFYATSVLNASAAGAVTGGTQNFYDTNIFNASVKNALNGGTQNFYGQSSLNARVAGSVNAGSITLYEISTLNVQIDNALTGATRIAFDKSQGLIGGTLKLNGHSTAVGSIRSETEGAGVITNNGAADGILTVGALGESTTFSGVIQDGTGAGRLGLKLVGGTLVLAGEGTYTGTTEVEAGTLRLENDNASPHYTIASGAVLELAPETSNYSASTTFSGSGTLRKTGAVSARWAGASATFALDVGSLIDVQQGTFVGGANDNEVWTDNQSSLHVASGASFNGVEANVRMDALTGSGLIRSGFSSASYENFTFGVANGSGVFDGVLANNESYAGHYVKVGTGTQTLTGANTYTGTTTVKGGKLIVSGSGASISHKAANFIVGHTSGDDGALTISDGARVANSAGIIGYDSGSTGTVAVEGAGSTWANYGNLYVGDSGAGALTISDGGTVTVGDTLSINEHSTVTLDGGALHTQNLDLSDGDFHFLGGTLVANGTITGDLALPEFGALGGNATITGDLLVSGTLSPGNSTGTITVEGDLTLNDDAWVTLELASLTDFDQIVVNGALTFGGTLMLNFIDGFTLDSDAEFTLFTGGYTLSSGTFANIGFSTPGFDGIFDYETGSLTINVIPEPSTYGLMIVAPALLIALRCRRRCRTA